MPMAIARILSQLRRDRKPSELWVAHGFESASAAVLCHMQISPLLIIQTSCTLRMTATDDCYGWGGPGELTGMSGMGMGSGKK